MRELLTGEVDEGRHCADDGLDLLSAFGGVPLHLKFERISAPLKVELARAHLGRDGLQSWRRHSLQSDSRPIHSSQTL
jgi:hypothetical protein